MKMGGLVEDAILKAATSLETRDEELAEQVRNADRAIDELEEQINEEAARIIAVRQPAAVDLRVTVYRSCCSLPNCVACDDASLSLAEKDACYARRCCCFGATCDNATCCSGSEKEVKRHAYNCGEIDQAVVLPGTSLVGVSLFDLDTGPNNECTEKVTASNYAYYVSPLRPASGNAISTSTLLAPARPQPSSTQSAGSAPSHCRSALGSSCAAHQRSRSQRSSATSPGASASASTTA